MDIMFNSSHSLRLPVATPSQDTTLLPRKLIDQLRHELRPLLREILRDLKDDTSRPATAPGDRLVSRRDAAKMLGVSVQTVVKMFERGDLTFSRIGRRVLIRESEVVMLINHRTSNPEDAQ